MYSAVFAFIACASADLNSQATIRAAIGSGK